MPAAASACVCSQRACSLAIHAPPPNLPAQALDSLQAQLKCHTGDTQRLTSVLEALQVSQSSMQQHATWWVGRDAPAGPCGGVLLALGSRTSWRQECEQDMMLGVLPICPQRMRMTKG